MNKVQEFESKVVALRNIYSKHGKKGLLLERQNNMSWLLEGRTHINLAALNGVVDVLVNDKDIYLISNNIEAGRMAKEEFLYDITVKEYYWYETSKRKQYIEGLTEGSYVTDTECENEIKSLRLVMTPIQREIYFELGRDTAQVIEETCMGIKSGMTEFETAGIMAQKCMERGMEPAVMLVAADERINLYRHPLPTSKMIDDYVMIVIGTRRYGQMACITRFIAFSEPSERVKRAREAVQYLDSLLLEETRPGTNTARLFNMLVEGYKEQGYSDEWKLHHQGGLCGYNSREYKAAFDVEVNVEIGQIYAWNPSITGFKAEDTFLVEQDRNMMLTATKELPYKTVEYKGKKIERPDILVRKIYR